MENMHTDDRVYIKLFTSNFFFLFFFFCFFFFEIEIRLLISYWYTFQINENGLPNPIRSRNQR